MVCNETLYSDHAIAQMFKRNISVDNIKQVIESGEVLFNYWNDKPYPSCLTFGYVNNRPLHVVIAKDNLERCIIITAYEPDENIWEADFKSKK